jgi:hypothetical protein
MGFGPWRRLGEAPVPDGGGLLQARLGDGSQGLQRYPRGQSAMVYYDGGPDLAAALARFVARIPEGERENVRVRFAASATPEADLSSLISNFVERFGAKPRWNS